MSLNLRGSTRSQHEEICLWIGRRAESEVAPPLSRGLHDARDIHAMADKKARLRKFIASTKAEINRATCSIIEVADDETEADTIREIARELSDFLDHLPDPDADRPDHFEVVIAVRNALLLGAWEDVIPGRTAQRKGTNARRTPEEQKRNIDDIVIAAVKQLGCKPSKTIKAAINILPVARKIAEARGDVLSLTPNAVLQSLTRIKIDRDQ